MGSGIVGWLTPGWTSDEPRLHPSIPQPSYVKEMLKNGEDPKPLVLEDCKPQCMYYKGKIERCEGKLEHIIKVDPTKTCLYAMRDWVNCVEACAQPLVHNQLEGTH